MSAPTLRPASTPALTLAVAVVLAAVAVGAALPTPREITAGKIDYASATAITENDVYTLGTRSDRYYTTGQKITRVSEALASFGDAFEMPGLRQVAKFASPAEGHRRVAFSIGQNLFTPANLQFATLQTDDRPYAGWLYLSTALQSRPPRKAHQTHDRLTVWGADLGVIGPWAAGKPTQDFVHRHVSHSALARGWHHQLANEPGLNLYHQSKVRHTLGDRHTLAADLIGHAGFSLGNVATYANTGAALRVGFALPDDFGADIIRSGADTTQAGGEPPSAWGAHLFGGFDVRMVGRDIFLHGNTLSRSHRVAPEVFVGDFQFGLTLNYRRIVLALSQVRRTPEFKLQGHAQAYGSIMLTIPISARRTP
jgi:hypothetical protein